MLILVSGGSASGKSRFAEGLMTQSGIPDRVYAATMRVLDGESAVRVARHRDMRAGKGFATLELPEAGTDVSLPPHCAVLLEDLPNLTANEWFGPVGRAGAEARILAALDALDRASALLVVVTGELTRDGNAYDPDTTAYLNCLTRLGRALAAKADAVYEVVCGVPIRWKGEQL